MPAKFYLDKLRFAGVTPENPICSDYIPACVHMHDNARQLCKLQIPTYLPKLTRIKASFPDNLGKPAPER